MRPAARSNASVRSPRRGSRGGRRRTVVELAHDLETVAGPGSSTSTMASVGDRVRAARSARRPSVSVARRSRAGRPLAPPSGVTRRRSRRSRSCRSPPSQPHSQFSRRGSCAGNRRKSSPRLGRRRSLITASAARRTARVTASYFSYLRWACGGPRGGVGVGRRRGSLLFPPNPVGGMGMTERVLGPSGSKRRLHTALLVSQP